MPTVRWRLSLIRYHLFGTAVPWSPFQQTCPLPGVGNIHGSDGWYILYWIRFRYKFGALINANNRLEFSMQSLYMAVVVYAPALALSQGNAWQKVAGAQYLHINIFSLTVTGIHVYISVTAIFAVCIFYTVVVRETITIFKKTKGHLAKAYWNYLGWNEGRHVDRYCSSYYHVHFNGCGRFLNYFLKWLTWTSSKLDFTWRKICLQVVFKGDVDKGGSAAVWAANQATDRVEFGEYGPGLQVFYFQTVWINIWHELLLVLIRVLQKDILSGR